MALAQLLDADATTRAGLPTVSAVELMHDWDINVSRASEILGLSRRQFGRLRKDQGSTLGPVESDRMMRVQKVLEQALAVFDSRAVAIEWLGSPIRALNGRSPLSLLDTDAGIESVRTVLGRIEHGVFS